MNTDEFFAALKADTDKMTSRPDYPKLLEQAHQAIERDEKSILDELRSIGIEVESLDFLPATRFRSEYQSALPILLKHLKKKHFDRVRWSLARCFTVPEAATAWNILLEEYETADSHSEFKQGLANALSVLGISNHIDELIALLKDPRHGESRFILLDAVRRSKKPQARRAVEQLANDVELGPQIRRLLSEREKRRAK